jgi:hypothetical protein
VKATSNEQVLLKGLAANDSVIIESSIIPVKVTKSENDNSMV